MDWMGTMDMVDMMGSWTTYGGLQIGDLRSQTSAKPLIFPTGLQTVSGMDRGWPLGSRTRSPIDTASCCTADSMGRVVVGAEKRRWETKGGTRENR
jgi:hypothetical protein